MTTREQFLNDKRAAGIRHRTDPRCSSAGPKIGVCFKACYVCGDEKPLDKFPVSNPPFRWAICVDCLKIHNAKLEARGVKPISVYTLGGN